MDRIDIRRAVALVASIIFTIAAAGSAMAVNRGILGDPAGDDLVGHLASQLAAVPQSPPAASAPAAPVTTEVESTGGPPTSTTTPAATGPADVTDATAPGGATPASSTTTTTVLPSTGETLPPAPNPQTSQTATTVPGGGDPPRWEGDGADGNDRWLRWDADRDGIPDQGNGGDDGGTDDQPPSPRDGDGVGDGHFHEPPDDD